MKDWILGGGATSAFVALLVWLRSRRASETSRIWRFLSTASRIEIAENTLTDTKAALRDAREQLADYRTDNQQLRTDNQTLRVDNQALRDELRRMKDRVG